MRNLPFRLAILSLLLFVWHGLWPMISYAQQTEQMNVSATVAPRPSDYQFAISADPGRNELPQGDDILYTITYGSYLTASTDPVTITATFSPGRIRGVTISSLFPAEYIGNSATNAIGDVEPVINVQNHSISWTIPSLPGNTTDQNISFRIKLKDSYTGAEPVDFDITAQLTTPDLTINQIASKSYLYHPIITTPTPTPTAVPTPSPIPLSISNTQIPRISDTVAHITFTTPLLTRATVYYGTDPLKLTQNVVSRELSRFHTILLQNLKPDTTYYYYIVVKDNATSRTYRATRISFHTASRSAEHTIDLTSLIISSGNTIFNPYSYANTDSSTAAILTLPINTEYGFQIRFPFTSTIAKVQALLRNADILGFSINTLLSKAEAETTEPTTDAVDMNEAAPGVYVGKLKTKPLSGTYELVLRVADVYGNVTENTIGKIQVVKPFTVLWSQSDTPVEHARIFLSRYNLKNDSYTPLSPTFLSTNNPIYTTSAGIASFVLPDGRYKAEVSYQGSKTTVEFDINGKGNSRFPIVHLTQEAISISSRVQYYVSTFLDVVLYQSLAYIQSLRNSIAFYDLTGAISLLILVMLTIVAFMSRTFINITMIPTYIIHMIHTLFKTEKNTHYIAGTVIDGSTRKPIGLAYIAITDVSTNMVIATLQTDRSGHYFRAVNRNGAYTILVIKRGYEHLEPIAYQPELSPYHIIHVLHVSHTHKKNIIHTSVWILATLFGFCFEILLVLSVIFEFLFMEYFGLSKTLPYFAASLCNLLLWWLYIQHTRQHTID